MVSNTNSSCRIALHKKAAALETRTGFPGCQASQALFVALGKPNLSSWTNSFHEISTVPTTVALHCPATLKTLEKTSEKKIEGTQNTFPKRSYSYTFARIHPCQHPWKASIFPLIHPCNSQAPSASGVAGTGGVGGFGRASKALTVSNTSFRSFFYRNARQHRDVSLPGQIQNLLPQEPGSKLLKLSASIRFSKTVAYSTTSNGLRNSQVNVSFVDPLALPMTALFKTHLEYHYPKRWPLESYVSWVFSFCFAFHPTIFCPENLWIDSFVGIPVKWRGWGLVAFHQKLFKLERETSVCFLLLVNFS